MTWAPPPTPPPGSRPSRPTGAAALRAARLRRRTWWLLGAVPVVVALLVLGFKLAFLAPIAAAGADRYAAGDGDGAADTFGIQRTFNLVEPWKAHFNHGTALASTEDTWALYDAITSLDRAYDLAENESPEERCLIQTNLSLTYEIQGDVDMAYADELAAELALVEEAIAARDAGRPYDEGVLDPYGDGSEEPDPAELRQDVQDWYQYAEREYATAEQVRGWPDCGESERTPEEEEQDAAATQRLQDKQQQARDAQPENDGGDTQEGEGSDGDEQSEASGEGSEGGDQQSQAEREEQQRQERLQEQGSEAREEQERLEQEYRDLYGDQPGSGTDPGDGGGGGTKNW
ncbi:hypothetical protein [Cellulosimicrobium composti]|uniref:hypothetical protein n=1 Tax=Cellulosimicrobium composti TaxID=2672572 RepID=UPI003799E5C8